MIDSSDLLKHFTSHDLLLYCL